MRHARFVLALAGLSCLLLGGCKTLMGDGFNDDMAHWGESHRQADSESGEMAGVSAKSQQIERNLGVR